MLAEEEALWDLRRFEHPLRDTKKKKVADHVVCFAHPCRDKKRTLSRHRVTHARSPTCHVALYSHTSFATLSPPPHVALASPPNYATPPHAHNKSTQQ